MSNTKYINLFETLNLKQIYDGNGRLSPNYVLQIFLKDDGDILIGRDNFDTQPTEGSDNLVKSRDIYSFVNSIVGDINTALAVILGEEEES